MIGAGQQVRRHRVLPDGCADLVWIGAAPAVVAGPATVPVEVPLAPGTIVIGVRLLPGAVPAVLGLPASELRDRDTPLTEIWGPGAAALSAVVGEQASVAGRQLQAEAALIRLLAASRPPDRLIAAATGWLARHPTGRVERLARVLEIGERRLHRRFTAAVGYGPKTFQRVMRLQRVLQLASRRPPRRRASRARRGGRLCRSGAYGARAAGADRAERGHAAAGGGQHPRAVRIVQDRGRAAP